MALEHPCKDQLPQRAMGPPGGLDEEHDLRLGVVAVVGRSTSGVMVDRYLELFARRPDRLVVRRVERGQPRAWWCAGQQHAAGQSCTLGPPDLGNSCIDVV